MEISPIEGQIDEYLRKEAGYVFGDPQNLGQIATQTALYMAPVTGTAMTLKDAYNDFRNGHFWGGLLNTGLGVASGIADVFTLGAGGTAMRAALAGGKGTARAAMAGGKAMARAALTAGGRAARSHSMATRMLNMGHRGLGMSTRNAARMARFMTGASNFAQAGRSLNPSINYFTNKGVNALEDRSARKALGPNPQQQQPFQQQQQPQFQFGAQQQNVPPARPRYGYNYNTYRYDRMY